MASTLCYDLIDAMTEIPFAGNPTPVFLLGKNQPWLSDSKMQLLAREMFHSESVFVRQPGNGVGHFDIVFFTPFAEESFCSHGIMGATYVLSGVPPANQDGYSFRLRNGIVAQTCVSSQTSSKRSLLGEIREIIMVIPSAPPSISHASVTSEKTQIERFAQALKIDIDQVLHIGLNSLDDWVIELDPSLDISSMNMYIDPCTLLEASPKGTGSQIITTRSRTPGVDFYKRVFAYGSEDQGTGSTYSALGPYWSTKLSKAQLCALQPSARGASARLDCNVPGEVKVFAKAMKVATGQIMIP